MAWLLDTNVLSELRRLKPEPNVLAFIAGHPLDRLYISAVTLAELRFGIELKSEGSSRRDELNNWLTREVRPMFEERVLQVTEDILFRWRMVVEVGRKAGPSATSAISRSRACLSSMLGTQLRQTRVRLRVP
jgi:predicted nucleic acid-binding protein